MRAGEKNNKTLKLKKITAQNLRKVKRTILRHGEYRRNQTPQFPKVRVYLIHRKIKCGLYELVGVKSFPSPSGKTSNMSYFIENGVVLFNSNFMN